MKHESRPEAAIGDRLAGDQFDSQDTADSAELAVVGAILAPPPLDVLQSAVARLKPSDFANVRCRFLFGVIVRMVAEGIAPDLITLPAFVRADAIELPVSLSRHLGSVCHEISCAAPVPAMLPYYVDAVLDDSARRRLDAAGRRLCEIAAAGDSESVARCLGVVSGAAL